jgi:hypothetical protein
MARPTKLTEDRMHKIATFLRNGNTIAAACAATNTGERTFYHWMERGEADAEHEQDTIFGQFWQAITRAQGESEAILTRYVFEAAGKDWRAALAILERRFPERWVARTEAHVTGSMNSRVLHSQAEVVVEVPDDDERIAEVTAVLGQIGVLGD